MGTEFPGGHQGFFPRVRRSRLVSQDGQQHGQTLGGIHVIVHDEDPAKTRCAGKSSRIRNFDRQPFLSWVVEDHRASTSDIPVVVAAFGWAVSGGNHTTEKDQGP